MDLDLTSTEVSMWLSQQWLSRRQRVATEGKLLVWIRRCATFHAARVAASVNLPTSSGLIEPFSRHIVPTEPFASLGTRLAPQEESISKRSNIERDFPVLKKRKILTSSTLMKGNNEYNAGFLDNHDGNGNEADPWNQNLQLEWQEMLTIIESWMASESISQRTMANMIGINPPEFSRWLRRKCTSLLQQDRVQTMVKRWVDMNINKMKRFSDQCNSVEAKGYLESGQDLGHRVL